MKRLEDLEINARVLIKVVLPSRVQYTISVNGAASSRYANKQTNKYNDCHLTSQRSILSTL